MKRLSSWALPIILGVAGVALIIVGSLDLGGGPAPSLAPIASRSPVGLASPTPTATPEHSSSASASAAPTSSPTATPLPDDVVAVQLDVPSVGIQVRVFEPSTKSQCDFPPSDGAYLICRLDAQQNLLPSYQPGHHKGTYIFAHALNPLFKPLWNVQVGAQVLILMSDGTILEYVINEVRPNVACPDRFATDNNPDDFGITPPLALQIHTTCDEARHWLTPVDYERLILQTSQGYNRNWGELVVVADPVEG